MIFFYGRKYKKRFGLGGAVQTKGNPHVKISRSISKALPSSAEVYRRELNQELPWNDWADVHMLRLSVNFIPLLNKLDLLYNTVVLAMIKKFCNDKNFITGTSWRRF